MSVFCRVLLFFPVVLSLVKLFLSLVLSVFLCLALPIFCLFLMLFMFFTCFVMVVGPLHAFLCHSVFVCVSVCLDVFCRLFFSLPVGLDVFRNVSVNRLVFLTFCK